MNGASLMEIAVVLGHKTLEMVRRYAHLTDAHVDSVVRGMNAKIFGAAEVVSVRQTGRSDTI
jgi:phage terminase Nu1 subunit (DNA packaging protein)